MSALAHAVGRTFIELQQLEFEIISFLSMLSEEPTSNDSSFDVLASKTLGNLLRAMEKCDYLGSLANELRTAKERRDFFIHRFLFHRYGGPEFTTDDEFELLIRDAIELGDMFAIARESFAKCMLNHAPLKMFAMKQDPETGEFEITESKHLTKVRESNRPKE